MSYEQSENIVGMIIGDEKSYVDSVS